MEVGCTGNPEELELIKELGYDFVELKARQVCQLDEGETARLAGRLERLALPCLGFNLYCPPEVVIAGPGSDEAVTRDYATACARRGAQLGIRVVGIGSPRSRHLPQGFSREVAAEQLRSFLRITGDVFGQRGIAVCLEALGPCYCNFINMVPEAAAVVADLAHPHVGLLPDLYNMEHSGEGDLDLAPYLHLVRHLHISDDNGSPQGRDFLRPERAGVHQDRLARLRRAGYRGTISVEVDLPVERRKAAWTRNFLKDSQL